MCFQAHTREPENDFNLGRSIVILDFGFEKPTSYLLDLIDSSLIQIGDLLGKYSQVIPEK